MTAEIFDLYKNGMSYKKIGTLCGKSRSAVGRLVKKYMQSNGINFTRRGPVKQKPEPIMDTTGKAASKEPTHIEINSFEEAVIKNTCRYIVGDRKNKTDCYCGNPVYKHWAYCKEHFKICYAQKS